MGRVALAGKKSARGPSGAHLGVGEVALAHAVAHQDQDVARVALKVAHLRVGRHRPVLLGGAARLLVLGIAEAARTYYAKEVGALSVGEAALLAGMPKAPGRFSPYLDPERAEERRGLPHAGA